MYSYDSGYKPDNKFPIGAVLWGMVLALCIFLFMLFIAFPDLVVAGKEL